MPARAVLVGSRHTAESLWAAMPLEGLRERTFLGPPGVDVHTFVPREPRGGGRRAGRPRALARHRRSGPASTPPRPRRSTGSATRAATRRRAARSWPRYARATTRAASTSARPTRSPRSTPRATASSASSGKLIVSKGIDLLLAAWPLVLAREPNARLVVVGFGTYREGLEVLLRGLERADERLLMHVCRYGRELEGGPRDQLTYLRTFLESLAGRHERYFAAAKKMRETIAFTGRLDHGELARVLPAAEAVVVPSMFPEAFGMVAAEAAACGALPVCAGSLRPGGGGERPGGDALAAGARAAHLRARHAGGRGIAARADRLARDGRTAAPLGPGGAGADRGGPLRLGVGRRVGRQCLRGPHGGAGAGARGGSVLATARASDPPIRLDPLD